MSEDIKTEDPKVPEYVEKLQAEAIEFAVATNQNFDYWMNKSRKVLPIDTPDTRIQQLDTFIDALAGTTVQIVGRYCNSDLSVEEALVNTIRGKFKLLRQAEIMMPGKKKSTPRLIS